MANNDNNIIVIDQQYVKLLTSVIKFLLMCAPFGKRHNADELWEPILPDFYRCFGAALLNQHKSTKVSADSKGRYRRVSNALDKVTDIQTAIGLLNTELTADFIVDSVRGVYLWAVQFVNFSMEDRVLLLETIQMTRPHANRCPRWIVRCHWPDGDFMEKFVNKMRGKVNDQLKKRRERLNSTTFLQQRPNNLVISCLHRDDEDNVNIDDDVVTVPTAIFSAPRIGNSNSSSSNSTSLSDNPCISYLHPSTVAISAFAATIMPIVAEETVVTTLKKRSRPVMLQQPEQLEEDQAVEEQEEQVSIPGHLSFDNDVQMMYLPENMDPEPLQLQLHMDDVLLWFDTAPTFTVSDDGNGHDHVYTSLVLNENFDWN